MFEKMRALVLDTPGGPEVLQVRDIPKPKIERPQDALIKVVAAGINPADWQNRKSGQRPDPDADAGSPTTLGIDGVGVVEDIGDAVDNVAIGDEVWYIDGGYPGNPGSYAEYKVIQGAYLSRKPKNLDFVQAAALPVVGLTAWEAVFDKGCQSAPNIDPFCLSNFDPPYAVDQRLACPALAGVAEGRPSAGDVVLGL